jgi:hypothetical protein
MFAAIKGNGFSDELAKDFWVSPKEDPWNSGHCVSRRWWKLLFAYSMSGLVQILLPVGIIVAVYRLITDQAWQWLFVAVGIGAVGGVLGAMLAATRVCLRISRERKLLGRGQ